VAQKQVIGRHKLDGAPLGQSGEFSPLDLDARDAQGNPVIPATAHVRLSAPQTNGGAVIVRRATGSDGNCSPDPDLFQPPDVRNPTSVCYTTPLKKEHLDGK
jgi:deferrochelatase/peroxidase EfeB